MNKIRQYREGLKPTRYFFSLLLYLSHLMLFVLLLGSCSQGNSNSLTLFNGNAFQLTKQENAVNIRPEDKDYFNRFVRSSDIQIPLFRRVEASSHSIFIGLPVGTSLEELLTLEAQYRTASSTFTTDSNQFFHHRTQQGEDSMVVTTHVRLIDHNLVYLIVIAPQKSAIKDRFAPDSLAARFIKP